jgi:shikimate kinase
MRRPGNIFLTGMMGSGKTSVGQVIASSLGYEFVDTDLLIEAKSGMSVGEIFAGRGEEFFRKEEKVVLAEVAGADCQVVATGGGMLAVHENMDFARSRGFVIYLNAPPEVLAQRLAGESNRPLLLEDNPEVELQRILEVRRPEYERADFLLKVTDLSIEEAATKIMQEFEQWLAA